MPITVYGPFRRRVGRRVVRARIPKETTTARMRLRQMRLRKLIKKVVRKDEELKHVGVNAVDAAFNSTISSAAECYNLMPQVTEGTSGCQRLGDKITGRWLTVRGKIQISNAFLAANQLSPITCRVMILTQKNLKVGSDVSSRADVAHLLKDNIGTDVARAYNGTNFDNLAPINRDLFTVYMDKKFKFKWDYHGNYATAGAAAGTNKTYYFTKRIKVPTTLHFDDGNGNYVNNFAPFICMGSMTDDNSGAYSVGTPVYLNVQSELFFTDA